MHYTGVCNFTYVSNTFSDTSAAERPARQRQRLTAFVLAYLCEICGYSSPNRNRLDSVHASFKGRFFCAADRGPAAAQQWLQEQKAAALEKRRMEDSRRREEKRRQRGSPLPLPSDYLCQFCAFYADTPDAVDDQHAAFQGRLFCALEEGPGGRTPQQWLQEQRVAAEQSRQPPRRSSSSSGTPGQPTRCTQYRRRMAKRKDEEVLQSQTAEASEPGEPCNICGQERRLDDGHAYFKGQFFCSMEEGPGGRTAERWLEDQRETGDVGRVPRTTAWNLKKRWEREEEEKYRQPASDTEPVPGGSEEGKKRRKHKPHKPHKLRICQRCGQPMQKMYGHSQYGGKHFCALHAGKSVDLWLAEQRSRQRK